MAILSFPRVHSPRPLLLAGFVPVLILACASNDLPQYRGEPVALKIGESWDLLVEEPTDGFFETVGRNAEDVADTGGKSTAVVGCVAGAVTLAVLTQARGGEAGCMVGSFALYPVGYAVGYGTGALAGTLQGAINLFGESDGNVDMQALLTAIEDARPRTDLANAMIEQSRQLSLAPLLWSEDPDETDDEPAQPEAAFEMSLTITGLWLTTTTAEPPTSRLHLRVVGELKDAETGRKVRDGKWRYASESLSTAAISANDAAALKSELAHGWRTLAGDVVADLLDPAGG
ncbi:MAG: hypothetical protein R3285_03560 [Kiloniellales bacterium]|nr:hypothetical protein [Kiloniellales bacterium]